MRRPRKRFIIRLPEPNLIPVLSCMFLLIPALLLAMEVARMRAIHVATPQFSPHQATTATTPSDERKVSVMVRGDGYVVEVKSGAGESAREVIPLREGKHDLERLESVARTIAFSGPPMMRANVNAENDIDMQTLVQTLDALRGQTCSMAQGQVGEGCLFVAITIG